METYSRASFLAALGAATRRERASRLGLVAVAVGLGLGQLVLIRWADRAMPHATAVTVEAAVFLLYGAILAAQFWRLQAQRRRDAPRCPACGARLEGLSVRVALATSRCDSCGGQVLE